MKTTSEIGGMQRKPFPAEGRVDWELLPKQIGLKRFKKTKPKKNTASSVVFGRSLYTGLATFLPQRLAITGMPHPLHWLLTAELPLFGKCHTRGWVWNLNTIGSRRK